MIQLPLAENHPEDMQLFFLESQFFVGDLTKMFKEIVWAS